jgi:hypothetical protein
MKRFVNLLLSIFSPLAAVPTGWAIYAGVIKYPAFPMHTVCAILGATGIISTSFAAGLLVTDIKAFNQGLHNITEHKDFEMSTMSAWLIFGGCVLAEITLSLLIVVIPGVLAFSVLVFPLMTAAGVFAFAVRYDLMDREAELLKARADKKKSQSEEKNSQKSAGAKPANPKKSLSEFDCRYAGAGCGRKFASQNSANAHARSCGFKPTIAMPVDVLEPKSLIS